MIIGIPPNLANKVAQLFFEQDIVFISMFTLSLVIVLGGSIIAASAMFRKRSVKQK